MVASGPARWLDRQGGFILVIAGAALIALGIWRADKPAVAPLLTVFGAGMILLGAFYSRIEGSVEATKDGIKAVVREVERVAVASDLSPDEFATLISAALERFEPESHRRTQVLDAARRATDEAVADPEASPIALEKQLAGYVIEWLKPQGWEVTDYTMARRDVGYDLLATREDQQLLIELKLARYRPISGLLVDRAAASRECGGQHARNTRIAIVIGPDSQAPTQAALERARDLGIEIYRVGPGGQAEACVGAPA